MKKIIIDTNVLLRFFLKDIPEQVEKTEQVMQAIEDNRMRGLISILVMNELIWILRTYYKLDKSVYLPQIQKLLAFKNIQIIEVDKQVIKSILDIMFTKNIDFTDVYLSAIKGNNEVFSFDRNFKKLQK